MKSSNRPICQACEQRFCSINYYRDDKIHYRSRCDTCLKKNRKIKPSDPRWAKAGYKKKPACDRCGFKCRYSAPLLVFHIDGNLNNSNIKNLKTICQNCVIEVSKADLSWKIGDLEPDH